MWDSLRLTPIRGSFKSRGSYYLYTLCSGTSNADTIRLLKCVMIREVSSFQGVNNTYLYEVGIWLTVLIRKVSTCPLGGVSL